MPRPPYPQRQPGLAELQRYDPRYPEQLLQPDSRPISQEQLASEVKNICTGLTMVETKCIHVYRAQAAAAHEDAATDTRLASDHWQAIIALHRTLLHEHHAFFLASQHPSTSPALRRLAAKYSMSVRMWKHGIHSFLELLPQRSPGGNIDHMLAFIYLAYQVMALLCETLPKFEDTWIECLGDLGRYRMAIEDGNNLDLIYDAARTQNLAWNASLPMDTNFIKAHSLQFGKIVPTGLQSFEDAKQEFMGRLNDHIGRMITEWKEQGVYVAVTNIASWFSYGQDDDFLRQVFLSEFCERHEHTSTSHVTTRTKCDMYTVPANDAFRREEQDLPEISDMELPSDYLIRGLLWSDNQMCDFSWFKRTIEMKRLRTHISYLATPTESLQACFRVLRSAVVGRVRRIGEKVGCSKLMTLFCLAKIPRASATNGGAPLTDTTPSLGEETTFDYAMYSLMILYLLAAWWIGPKAKPFAMSLMLFMAILWPVLISDEFSAGVHKTVFKIWAVTNLHYVVQDCVDAANPKLHVIKFLGLSTLFEIVGSSMQGFPAFSDLHCSRPQNLVLSRLGI